MRKMVVVGAAALLLALIASAGGDPWKDKTYQQWDAKDCQKILFDSPWAQIVAVDAPWLSSGAGSGLPEAHDGANRSTPGGMGGYGSQGAGAGQPAEGGSDQGQTPVAKFLVRWTSARTEREAAVRNAILGGRIKESEADKFLSEPEEDYQVAVLGPDMTPFNAADEKTLQATTFLRPKKSKEKIASTKVQVQRDPNTQKVSMVIFFFVKKLANGEASIATEEKNIEFICAAGKMTLKTMFDTQRMADKQGRDL